MVYYKISLHKFLEKNPKLENVTLPSSYLKNSVKAIKLVCKNKSTKWLW